MRPPEQMTESQLVSTLVNVYCIPLNQARRIAEIAAEYGVKAEPVADGYVTVTAIKATGRYQIKPPRGKAGKSVASSLPARYSHRRTVNTAEPPKGIEEQMSPRGRAAVAEPSEDEAPAKDYTVYADKPVSETMKDFAEWIKMETGYEPDLRSVALAGTLRMEFQASEFNKERRAERQEARAQAAENAAAEAGDGEAAPRRGRPAGTGKSAASGAGTTGKRRGRPAATAEAPY